MKLKMVLIALITYSSGFSQTLNPEAVTQSMSKGMQPGIEVYIPNISDSNLKDAIDAIMKPYKGKCKKVKNTDEVFINGAIINEISDHPIAIHQLMIEKDNGYKYTAFFNLGDIFLDKSSTEKFAFATNLVKKIAMRASELGMIKILKVENKVLEKLLKEKEDLVKDNEKATKEIQKAKELMAEKEKAIKDNQKKMEAKASEIELQSKKLVDFQNKKALFMK